MIGRTSRRLLRWHISTARKLMVGAVNETSHPRPQLKSPISTITPSQVNIQRIQTFTTSHSQTSPLDGAIAARESNLHLPPLPPPHELLTKSIHEISQLLESKQVTSEELVQLSLDRIEATKHLNAFISVRAKEALAEAKEATLRAARGERKGILDGVPIGVKDNFCVLGTETTASSRVLSGYIAPYTATVVKLLQEAGAIVVGKTNLDEFAMGSFNQDSSAGPAYNPHSIIKVGICAMST